jgi:hypothetical protein
MFGKLHAGLCPFNINQHSNLAFTLGPLIPTSRKELEEASLKPVCNLLIGSAMHKTLRVGDIEYPALGVMYALG